MVGMVLLKRLKRLKLNVTIFFGACILRNAGGFNKGLEQ
jgi:hypothetical protein